MKEVAVITRLEQAKALINPIRVQLLSQLSEPRTTRDLAEKLSLTPQRINHHLKEMVKAKLIKVSSQRQVRNLIEATYQAEAKAYWLSPRLLRDPSIPDEAFRDRLSLHNLLVLSETVQEEVGRVLDSAEHASSPSLGLSVEISLGSEAAREKFTEELIHAVGPILEKYQSNQGPRFRTTLMTYPLVK